MTTRQIEAAIGLGAAVLGIAMLRNAAIRDARVLGLGAAAVPLLVTGAGVLLASGKLGQIGGAR